MSVDQDGCEWVNVSSGVVRVVLYKGQLNGRLCVVYVTVGRPSIRPSVPSINRRRCRLFLTAVRTWRRP